MKEILLGGRIYIDLGVRRFYFWKYMNPNPFLTQVRARIAMQGGWSFRVLHPSALVRCEAPQRRVFLITREDRRFAVGAYNFLEADNRLTTLLA
jgi:hypothetical protein